MIQKTMCQENEVLRLMTLYRDRAETALEHAQRGLNQHCETKAVRGVVDQAELVWEFDQILAVWEPILEHFEEQEAEFFMSDLSSYARGLQKKASESLTTISFERLTRWNFYEQKARLTVAEHLTDIFRNVYVNREAA